MQRNGDVSGMISMPLEARQSEREHDQKLGCEQLRILPLCSALTSVFPCQHSVKPVRPFNP